jgi:hypothetical protein
MINTSYLVYDNSDDAASAVATINDALGLPVSDQAITRTWAVPVLIDANADTYPGQYFFPVDDTALSAIQSTPVDLPGVSQHTPVKGILSGPVSQNLTIVATPDPTWVPNLLSQP